MQNTEPHTVICRGYLSKDGQFTPDNKDELIGKIKEGDIVRFVDELTREAIEPGFEGICWMCAPSNKPN